MGAGAALVDVKAYVVCAPYANLLRIGVESSAQKCLLAALPSKQRCRRRVCWPQCCGEARMVRTPPSATSLATTGS